MWIRLRFPALLLVAAALLGCQDQRITAPAPQDAAYARVLQAGQYENSCQSPQVVALRTAAGAQLGEATVWNGPTMAYVRFTAPEGAEFTEVRVTGARRPEQFPRTRGAVNPSRFRFGGLVSPPQPEVVVEALHLGNPYNVLPGEEVLLAAFARVQPIGGGTIASVWAEGTPFAAGKHPMYLRYTVQSCGSGGQLEGPPGDPAAGAIPTRPFVPRPQDYAADHPQLPGLYLSFNTVLLVLEAQVTVAQANALLAQLDAQIVGGIRGAAGVPGILFLRLPTRGHAQLEAVLAQLRADARVKHVAPDVLLQPMATTRDNGGTPTGWTWEHTPAGGNWGMELARVPQMWNLNAAVRKVGGSTIVGVVDAGFARHHEDLVYLQNLTPEDEHGHGTHVAGIISAGFDNATGVDGINPFAQLLVGTRAGVAGVPDPPPGAPDLDVRLSAGMGMVWSLHALTGRTPAPRVVNFSAGYNWWSTGPPVINPMTDTTAQRLVSEQGAIFSTLVSILRASNVAPLVVVSAGNDTEATLGQINARWNSPMANAGLDHGTPEVLVVEALENSPGASGGARRWSDSNDQGDLSAPGAGVLSTYWSEPIAMLYRHSSGTSMAAPHVTGLASYLLALDPALSNLQLRQLLLNNGVPVDGGARPRMDAFASALDIDRLRGNTRVLRMLLDIDDGTLDGNQRWDPVTGREVTDEDADRDGGVGDGRLDMKDFRRWRDWLLQVENPAGLSLDGAPAHPKKDVNGNGAVEAAAAENVYPRGDFNGDGILSRLAMRAVPGAMEGQQATDLQVLQRLFSDEHYTAGELPWLLDSGDLLLDASACLTLPGAALVRSSIRPTGSESPVQQRVHNTARPAHVYTAPVIETGYTLRVEAVNASERVIGRADTAVALPLGGDVHWRALCEPEELIAFASERDGNFEIYIMNADGSGVLNLSNHPNYDYGPTWSPDGRRIAFVSWRDGNSEIYIMNADGSGVRNLSNHPSSDSEPVWSPDGSQIAFTSGRDGSPEVYVMNADGSGKRNLSNHPARDWQPAWSPDGSRIAFVSERDGNREIYAVDADGSGLQNLTAHPYDDLLPSWSPNSSRIAFIGLCRDDLRYFNCLSVMNADGTNVQRLTDAAGSWTGSGPVWSSDGSRIAFISERDGNIEIYVINADGSNERNLSNHPEADWEPIWSPDGNRIAFSSSRNGNWEIYVMNADGSNVQRLTAHPAQDRAPRWRP